MKKGNFTQIPNEILEALARTNLSPYEGRYIFALLRKTFGWGKDRDYIANSQFTKITGIRRPHVCRTEIKLLGRKIITSRGNKIGINASFDQWRELPTEVIVTRRGKSITYKGNKKLPPGVATKESKELLQKKEVFSFQEILNSYKQGIRLYKPFYMNNPMRWVKDGQKWFVIEHGEWLSFADSEDKIEFR